MCSYWLRTWRHTCTLHLHTPFAYAIITKTSYAFFAKITLCIFYPMTPFAHAFAYAIKKTPYAFFAKITLCMLFSVATVSHSTALQTNHNASFNHMSHGEPQWLYFCCAMQIIIVCYSTKIRYFKFRTQSVRESRNGCFGKNRHAKTAY